MKKGRKPGEMQAARRRHLARQARQDAITKLKLGETVTISAWDADAGGGYRNFQVKPFTDETNVFSGDRVLIHMENKIQVATFIDKDGQKVLSKNSAYYIRWEQILGVVVSS